MLAGLSLAGHSALSQNTEPRVLTPRERLQQLVEDAGSVQFSDLIVQLPQTQMFAAWLKASELAGDFDTMVGMTVFVPVDTSWPDSLRSVIPSRNVARKFIQNHVIAERWSAVNQPTLTFTTVGGVQIRVDKHKINQFSLELTGLRVRNGFVHLMAGVL